MRKAGGERAIKLLGGPEDFLEYRSGLMKDDRSGVVGSEYLFTFSIFTIDDPFTKFELWRLMLSESSKLSE